MGTEKRSRKWTVFLSLIGRKTKIKCTGTVLLALIGSVLASIWPVRLGELYSNISGGRIASIKQGLRAVAVFGAIYLAAELIAIARRVLLDCIIAAHEAELRETSVERLLKMPVSYYSGCLSGERTAQLNQGVAGLSHLIRIFCNDVFAIVLTAVCTLVQVMVKAPSAIVGVMLLYMVLTVLISAAQIRSQNGIREEIIRQKNALDGQICQSIGNLELIRSMNAETYEKARLHPVIFRIVATEQRHHHCMGTFDAVKQGCKIVFQAALLLASIWMITDGQMEPGGAITVCLLFQQMIKPIDEVYRFMDEAVSSLIKAKVLAEVVNADEDPLFSIPHIPCGAEGSDIVLCGVDVTSPETGDLMARYENLRIPSGKIVALSGPSGCGKTTLIRLLVRYYHYTAGRIVLFGHSLAAYSQKDIARLIFYLPQQASFFAGSIRENLLYGMENPVSEETLLDALNQVCLLDVLRDKLPPGAAARDTLEYCIGEDGAGLSGGEGQRLAIARAFLRWPKLYIFDESTANLDAATAGTVLDRIEARARASGSGMLYITHDRNVLKRCDEVIRVENRVTSAPQLRAG